MKEGKVQNNAPVLAFITRNSYSKMQKAPVSLIDVLNSTLQIPYTDIILVDDSDDETRSVFGGWCDEHGKNLLVSGSKTYGYGRATRATARQTAIDLFLKNFSDEWLMFVDDDVILNEGWWNEAKKHMENPKNGIIWGINFDATSERHVYLKALGVDLVKFLIKEFYRRGGTHDTLLRRDAIRGIKIPSDLHVFEDWFILRYVQQRGYDAAIVKAGVTHYNPEWDYSIKAMREMAYLAKKYGVEPSTLKYGLYRLVRSMASIIPTTYASVKGFGVKEGLIRAYYRWRLKVFYRIFFLFS